MSEEPVRHCPQCGQALRFPAGVGGVLMACPNCGYRFASPFRLAGQAGTAYAPPNGRTAAAPPPVVTAPPLLIPPETVSPEPEEKEEAAETPPQEALTSVPHNTMAARVARLYASKS